jgi:hypothetical protein
MGRTKPTARTLAIVVLVVAVVAAAGGYGLWLYANPPVPPLPFRVIAITPGNYFAEEEQEAADAGGKVPPEALDLAANQASLAMADVQRTPSGAGFVDLLRKLPAEGPAIDQSVIFRVRDGMLITAAAGDAISDGNTGVIVVPQAIVMLFDSPQAAYLQIKLRISGLQP